MWPAKLTRSRSYSILGEEKAGAQPAFLRLNLWVVTSRRQQSRTRLFILLTIMIGVIGISAPSRSHINCGNADSML